MRKIQMSVEQPQIIKSGLAGRFFAMGAGTAPSFCHPALDAGSLCDLCGSRL